eukprot:evm.model.scf_366.6 EVM.evm.TU.scf_366.6   scf_366:72543-78385(+)
MAMDAVKSGPEASGGASRDAVTGGDEHSEGGEEGRYDVDSEGGDLEEEDDDSDGGGGDAGQGSSTPDAEIPEWVSLENHPVHTSQRIQAALMRLANNNRRNLTILLLGRTGAGKSSTANSLFGSRMFTVAPFNFLNYMPHQPNTISKRKVGVVVTIIDSVGLVESDSVSDTVFEGITKTFGPQIWKHLLIGLTRSEVRNPSPYSSYDEYVNKRVSGIRAAMRRAGAQDAASIPYALIENSSRCRKNAENEQILPNGCVWVPNLVERAVDLALRHSEGYKWNPRRRNLLRKFLLIPLLFIGQILFKLIVIDKLIEEDGVRGDQYGPYDLETQKEERRRVQERKEIERQQREEARRRARKARQRKQAELEGVSASDSDEEGDDYY